MDATMKNIFLLLFSIGYSNSEMIALDKKCKLDDAECLTEAIQRAVPSFTAGIPELGIEVLDVMKLDPIKFDLSGLQFSLNDGRLQGLKHAEIKTVKWDLEKKTVDVIYHINCTLTGHYQASGRILILPINGDGEMRLKLKNVLIKFSLSYNMKKKEDKEYVHLTKYGYEFDVIDNAHYHLTNLFNGNKQLSDAMHTFLNDNWKQISAEFGTPIIKAAAEKMFRSVMKFFNKNPIWDIAIM